MLVIYGSPLCPDCRVCKANLDAHGVADHYIDVSESMRNLKAFLKLRDSLPVFEPCRKAAAPLTERGIKSFFSPHAEVINGKAFRIIDEIQKAGLRPVISSILSTTIAFEL